MKRTSLVFREGITTAGSIATGLGARLSLLALLLAACSVPPASRPLTLLYTADAQGYLEECACSTGGELGGIARRAVLVDSLRQADPGTLLVEAGDFAGGPNPTGELAGWVAAEAMAKMNYDAVLPGEVELNLGPGFWDKVKDKVPWVHTNFGTPALGPPQLAPLIVEKDGRRIAVIGLLGPDLYFLPDARARLEIVPPLDAAAQALEKLEGQQVDLVVALVHMKPESVEGLAASHPEIDVFVAGHRAADLEQPQRVGQALLVSAGFLGQHLGDLRLSGAELKSAENKVLRIETSLPEDPAIERWVGIATRK
jgi:2',3'-cyclic-nucleotide 2'-phosphodiesterase (5'-nucleotidase family)